MNIISKGMGLAVLLVTLSMGANAASQKGVLIYKGKVTDNKGNAIEYATAAIANSEGKVLAGAAADAEGKYEMKSNDSVENIEGLGFRASFVGYKDFSADLVDMVAKVVGDTLYLKDATLEEDSQSLQSAMVTGKRELIEHQFDKIILNVSELAVAKTGDALDVLRNSPGVTIDKDGNVQLGGKNVAIWIDGRPSNLSGQDLVVFLKGSPGSTIDKVELMASPSAKYDAEGSGGIINIKTRKGFMQGLSGNVNMTGEYKFRPWRTSSVRYGLDGNASANIMYKTDKTYTMFTYTPDYGEDSEAVVEKKMFGDDYRNMQESLTNMDIVRSGHNVKLQHDWHIGSNDILGAIANVRFNDNRYVPHENSIISNYYDWETENQRLYSRLDSKTEQLGKGNFAHVNINYTHSFDESRASSLIMNADYSRNQSIEDNTQYNIWKIKDEHSELKDYGFFENNNRTLHLVSVKSDYSSVFWKQTGRIEAGLKVAMSFTDNKFKHFDYNTDTQPWELPVTASTMDNFNYMEWIAAAYVNVAKQFSPKWNAQLGLRSEATFTKGLWQDSAPTSDRYINFFPNATVSWMPSQKYIFSLNYAARISRPKYWQLNPYKSYINATTYVQGKADMRPEYTHNLSLTAILFGRMSINGGYSKLLGSNSMQIPTFDSSTGTMGLRYDNAGNMDMAYVSVGISEQPITKWWNFTANLSYSYTSFKAYPGLYTGMVNELNNKGGHFFGYASTTFYLPLNFKTGISGWYSSGQSVGFYKIGSVWTLDYFLSKSFLDGKLSVDLAVSDIFGGRQTETNIFDGDVKTYSIDQKSTSTGIRLGVSWRFGKNTSSMRNNVGKLDESSRM